ncbi:Histone-binding protein [Yarrowia sp. C11]|nr:Histone-binding protein [Yarrowia sp. E02]KAG5372775.1 Histone-binding protein [Yarrowia sp. C11]
MDTEERDLPQTDVDESAPKLSPEQLLSYENYRIWKKNAPQLYSLFMSHMLPSPALSFQWFPDLDKPKQASVSVHRFLTSSYTDTPEVIRLGEVKIPNNNETLSLQDYSALTEEIGGYQGHPQAGINMSQNISVLGEVNRVRYMPQNPNIIATIGADGSVLMFDKSKHPANPSNDECKADATLCHHKSEGWSLSWNPKDRGKLLTCASDGTVALWDLVNDYKSRSDGKMVTIAPKQIFTHHQGSVNDVTWHPSEKTLFASVGDDQKLFVVDTTDNSTVFEADTKTASLSVAFSPFNSRLVATSGEDGIINLWDFKSSSQTPIGRLVGHEGPVGSLDWSPHNPRLLVSGSEDKRAIVWDVSRLGLKNGSEKLFVHAGHTEKVTEVGWNHGLEGVVGSVAFNSLLHVWKVRD